MSRKDSERNREESNESGKGKKKGTHVHTVFIFNGFLLEMPERTWSACLDGTGGRKRG